MSELTMESSASALARRDLLRNVALAATLGGLEPAAAQHVHQAAAADRKAGVYTPKFFKDGEWKSVDALCELIVPGARNGGAKEFIDLLCSANPELAASWSGGLAWLNARLGKPFHEAAAADQTGVLDVIAYRKNDSAANRPGVRFFDLARRMTVDAYYTSAAGTAELGYMGNKGMSKFQVPAEAVAHAVKRSPIG
jgi:hypothetical protein